MSAEELQEMIELVEKLKRIKEKDPYSAGCIVREIELTSERIESS